MGKEIYNIINDMAEVLNASQMQKLQEVLVNRLSEVGGQAGLGRQHVIATPWLTGRDLERIRHHMRAFFTGSVYRKGQPVSYQ